MSKQHVLVVGDKTVTLQSGLIDINGKVVGSVNQGLKHGYHPAVKVEVGSSHEWLELDTTDLLNACCQKAAALYTE